MSREILFRGQRKSDRAWIYGNLLRTDDGIFIIQNHVPYHLLKKYEVLEGTICQYTGLSDNEGRKIFEGDIVLFTDNIKIKGTTSHTSKVEWNKEIGGFVFHAECIGYYNVNPSQIERYEVEVIGNIFDNPELLE